MGLFSRVQIGAFILAGSVLGQASWASAKIKVVTTTTDLKALVETVGGEKVTVLAIAKGSQDAHHIEAKPSFMVQLRDAKWVLAHGLDLESAWLDPLVRGSRNPQIQRGTKGFSELGPSLDPIEVSRSPVSRAQGDVHPGGNPHFQLDPIRMGLAAKIVAEHLGELDPGHREFYRSQALQLEKKLAEKTRIWKKRLEKTGIQEVVSYHKTFSYFYERFGIRGVLHLEPHAGIPPTAAHLTQVIQEMKSRNLRLVLIENYFSEDVSKKLLQQVPQAKVSRVPVSVEGAEGVSNTEALIENLVKKFEEARQ